MLESLAEKYRNQANVFWDYERENIHSLAKADIMISDFSGIVFDYIFLFDKPVIYVKQGVDLRPYDADDLEAELWQFRTLRETGVELKEEYFDRIDEVIKNVSGSAELHQARHKARAEAWQYPGEAGKRIADFMIKTVRT
jgi:CDP-glycerol glycerophosphotransferase (TagB/SpsB family)